MNERGVGCERGGRERERKPAGGGGGGGGRKLLIPLTVGEVMLFRSK